MVETRNNTYRASRIGRAAIAVFYAAAMTFLFGCAASRPDIRIDFDRSADFSRYSTYAYVEDLGTDRAGYSTLVTTYFRQAVDREMQARGYRYTERDPELLINFFADAREVTEIRPRHDVWVTYGYYGYRYGMYQAWPVYADGAQTVRYRVGTANVDIVDARRRQLIWEGVAEGRLTSDVIDDPRSAIHATVAELFQHYPGTASIDVAR